MSQKNTDEAATVNILDRSILENGQLTEESRIVYESSFVASEEAAKPVVEKIRASRRLGKDDFSIRINARD